MAGEDPLILASIQKETTVARAKKKSKQTSKKMPAARGGFSALEKNILAAKGVTAAQLKKMLAAGVKGRADFATVGDPGTLSQLTGMPAKTAKAVMAWVGSGTATGGGANVIIESADVVYCVHCKTRQPKDYKAGDLCPACGKQAEPVLSCYWCSASGPGKFCRQCGARFVPTGVLELALLLKREGVAKDEIAVKLEKMSDAEKNGLWGRVRR